MNRIIRLFVCTAVLTALSRASDAVWQWSVPMGEGRAFLWIPENCERVRAVVVGQHNMIEQGIFESPIMRRTLTELGFAEIFIAPPFDRPFAFDQGAGERFDTMMRALAVESGYDELAVAPVVPMGHSACASFPWNFAAWAPQRTLAILSIKGDAPQTDLTGSGAPNPDWGTRTIDGIPGLMIMSEQEWWEDRLTPLLKFRAAHPGTPLAVLADTGHGHFDATDELVGFLAMFIRKAAEARLGVGPVFDRPSGMDADLGRSEPGPTLKPVDPMQGWLAGRWRRDQPQPSAPESAAHYRGDPTEAFWGFDEEMARATDAYHAKGRGLKKQHVDFMQAGEFAPIATTHAGVELRFLPAADGLTFHLTGGFIAPPPPKAPVATKDTHKLPPPTIHRPQPADPGAHADGPVPVSPIVGPVEQLDATTFRVAFNRTFSTTDTRKHDIWFLARHPGDANFQGAVQQALLRLPAFTEGVVQTITFPALADQPAGTATVALGATTDAGLPVGYYVREGPAFVCDGVLHLTPVPPRAKFPVKITVVAWQFGRGSDPKVRAAVPVERIFFLRP